jgi:hypothetical protein
MKKKRGRKKGSGVLSGIPKHESWTEIRSRVIHDSAEWRLVRLRQLIGDGSKLADNHLSARKAKNEKTATKKRYVLLSEADSLWRDLSAQFERAVLNGDAGWFERQAKALGSVQQQEHARFNAAVIRAIEGAMWAHRAHQKRKRESATLTPAGKSVNETAHDIFTSLNVEVKDGRIIAEGCSFASKDACWKRSTALPGNSVSD